MKIVIAFMHKIYLKDKWSKVSKRLTRRKLKLAIVLVAVLIVTWAAYLRFVKGFPWADWTGLGEYTNPNGEYYQAKTLWDWMELLIIPVALALAALWFNKQERMSDREIQKQRDESERNIAADMQRESQLQAYFDKMTELLLEKNLRTSEDTSEIRAVARVRTLSALMVLDPARKSALIQFLIEAKLINGLEPIIDLDGANLERVNLEGLSMKWINLHGVNLQGANLIQANLEWANFSEADMQKADLVEANLVFADLKGANLQGADLEAAHLQGADLEAANLQDANLCSADLNQACLKWANFSGAKLLDVDFDESDLSGSNLRGEQLSEFSSLKGTIMPDGTIHE